MTNMESGEKYSELLVTREKTVKMDNQLSSYIRERKIILLHQSQAINRHQTGFQHRRAGQTTQVELLQVCLMNGYVQEK